MNFGNRFLVAKFLFSGSTHTKQRGALKTIAAKITWTLWELRVDRPKAAMRFVDGADGNAVPAANPKFQLASGLMKISWKD